MTQSRTVQTCWVVVVCVKVPTGGGAGPRAGEGCRGKGRRAGACVWGERAGLSPTNGNTNGIYGPNLQSTPRSGIGVNHFDIKIYVSWAKD